MAVTATETVGDIIEAALADIEATPLGQAAQAGSQLRDLPVQRRDGVVGAEALQGSPGLALGNAFHDRKTVSAIVVLNAER